jgi:regulator of protease activity HflC (stomatin/prohibitin superfamily)
VEVATAKLLPTGLLCSAALRMVCPWPVSLHLLLTLWVILPSPFDDSSFLLLPFLFAVSFSFNYQLKQTYEDISGLYLNFGDADSVDVLYQRIAKNVVRTVAGNFPASQFFINKENIRLAMFAALKTDLSAQSGNLQAFNLLDVTVPKALQAAISAQQNAQQDVIKAQNELLTAGINAESRVRSNASVAQLIVSGAVVSAQQLQQAVIASIESLQARYEAESTSYKALQTSLGLTPQQLLSYVWLDAQNDANNKGNTISSIVRVDGPAILN